MAQVIAQEIGVDSEDIDLALYSLDMEASLMQGGTGGQQRAGFGGRPYDEC